MERRLDQDLNRIRQSLLRMAGTVEEMVARATQALLERDAELWREVVRQDSEVDQMEIDAGKLAQTNGAAANGNGASAAVTDRPAAASARPGAPAPVRPSTGASRSTDASRSSDCVS